MPLLQTLKPNERGVALYDGKGNFLGYEDIRTLSDEQLEQEAAERTIAELSALADGDLKVPQIGKFLKALAKLRR